MDYSVLYKELQPCVLIACNCSPGEPFLLLIRGIQQIVACGFCDARYHIESVAYDSTGGGETRGPADMRLAIKRSTPQITAPRPRTKAN
jgi:hypothetical protein